MDSIIKQEADYYSSFRDINSEGRREPMKEIKHTFNTRLEIKEQPHDESREIDSLINRKRVKIASLIKRK